jgi:DNA-directed RNA polymerase subunit RPC12/RpoP
MGLDGVPLEWHFKFLEEIERGGGVCSRVRFLVCPVCGYRGGDFLVDVVFVDGGFGRLRLCGGGWGRVRRVVGFVCGRCSAEFRLKGWEG